MHALDDVLNELTETNHIVRWLDAQSWKNIQDKYTCIATGNHLLSIAAIATICDTLPPGDTIILATLPALKDLKSWGFNIETDDARVTSHGFPHYKRIHLVGYIPIPVMTCTKDEHGENIGTIYWSDKFANVYLTPEIPEYQTYILRTTKTETPTGVIIVTRFWDSQGN